MSIDIEALVASFLRGQDSVIALVGDRVYTDLPHQRTYPLVLITRTGGTSLYRNWLEQIDIEIGAYGGTHKLAYQLANTCLSAMAADLRGGHAEGVVTKFEVAATAYEPESDSTDPSGHARPRYTAAAVVTAHP